MARIDLQKCGKIFPTINRNNERTHGKIFSGSQIHKKRWTERYITTKWKNCNNNQTQKIKKTQEIHIWDQPISKLYTDDCGRFPIWSRGGNEYIIIAYHCDSNTILQAPFVNRKDKHRIRAYNSIS